MSLVIKSNISSLIAQRNLSANNTALQRSYERLSTGYRINSAKDDAAGMSIAENMNGQIRGNSQALNNIQDGINLLQTADGELSTVNEHLQRIRELCVQAASDTYCTADRSAVLDEIEQRLEDINRIADYTTFNNISLLNGKQSSMVIQIGANTTELTNTLDLKPALPIIYTSTNALNLDFSIAPKDWDSDKVRSYITSIDAAIQTIVSNRSVLGAYQNRLDATAENLQTMNDNLTASVSRIRDVDIAEESSTLTQTEILQQASVSILSKANALPQLALTLLQS